MASLMRSKTAVVYGGYNSIMDILEVRLPALIICREMADEEQAIHLQRLAAVIGENVTMVSESQIGVEQLEELLLRQLSRGKAAPYPIDTDGASRAARFLHGLLS